MSITVIRTHSRLACTRLAEWTAKYVKWAINLTDVRLLNNTVSVMGTGRNEANYCPLANGGSRSVTAVCVAVKSTNTPPTNFVSN